MTSSSTIHVTAGYSRIAILLDKLRLSLRFRLRLPEIDDVRNPLIAHAAAIGSLGRARLFKGAHARKRILLVFGIVVLMMGANSAFAQTQTCAIITGGNAGPAGGVSPAYLANQDGRANQGCTILITLNADGSITTTHPNPAPSYDAGFDDNMIAVVNNTAQTITGLQLTSTTVDIFGLDGDGVCSGPPGWTFSALAPNPKCAIATDPFRYGPAGINFTIFNPFSGIVNFGNGGIPPNGSAFFTLEGADLSKIVVIIDPGLAITKQVSVVGGGAALPGGQLDYVVHVTNLSSNPATSVVITDDLNRAGAGRLTFVNPPAPTMNGSTAGVTVVGSVLTADYSSVNGPLQPGQSIDVRFRAQIAAGLPAGTTLTNVALVTWNTPTRTSSASVSIDIGQTSTPDLVLTKTGPATTSLGQLGQFGLNVQNTGVTDSWNATILDRLPKASPTGGMCSSTPQILSAQVFQANGITPVPGKGPLVPGTDFSISYNGAPTCELTLTTLTAAATISQNQRLIINYQTQLDANSQIGATLTNVAGAIQWFDADPSVST
ncbi:MAG: isopeptide-forming domain-containing fimbrial protein, partial [Candidatus Acidiferrum sp.]